MLENVIGIAWLIRMYEYNIITVRYGLLEKLLKTWAFVHKPNYTKYNQCATYMVHIQYEYT